jgi:hypothetical protein
MRLFLIPRAARCQYITLTTQCSRLKRNFRFRTLQIACQLRHRHEYASDGNDTEAGGQAPLGATKLRSPYTLRFHLRATREVGTKKTDKETY